MRVLVCGGRDYDNYISVNNAIIPYFNKDLVIICGMASGADELAAKWARKNHVPLQGFLAEWGKHGIAAGPIRNQKMVDEGKPDIVLAFRGGKGTADMVRRARAAGIEVMEVE